MQQPLRARAYIRVSKEREEMYSPEIQLHAIESYCQQKGYLLVGKPVTDLDKTGRLWKTRQIEGLIQDIERKQLDVIVVWKLSRVSRDRLDWAIAVDRVETAGGRLESVTEQFDTTTSSGKFARGVLAEFAAFQSDTIGEAWKETHERRIRSGKPATGKPRFGYSYENKEFVVHPVEGPVLRRLYLDFTMGRTFRDLALELHGTFGRKWTVGALQRILDHGFGAGFLWVDGDLLPGAHEPVITEGEWKAYQSARNRRRAGARAESTDYPYSGLVKCPCGRSMRGRQQKGLRSYVCDGVGLEEKVHYSVVSQRKIDTAVIAWLQSVADDLNSRTKKHLKDPNKRQVDAKASIMRNLESVNGKIDRLVMKHVEGSIPQDSYNRLMEALQEEQKALEAALLEAEVATMHPVESLVPDLLNQWPLLPDRGKREVLKRLLASIEVHPFEAGKQRLIVPVPKW